MQVLHSLEDNTLQEILVEKYNLYLYLSNNRLVLTIYNPGIKKFLTLKAYESKDTIDSRKINKLKDDLPELEYNFKKKIIAFSNPKFTLVPAPFFKNAYKDEYYKINFNKESGESIKKDNIAELDSQLIYALSSNFTNIISLINPTKSFHASTPFLKSVLNRDTDQESNSVSIDINSSFFKIAIIIDGKLKLINSFTYKSSTDLLYHILNISKHFGINPDTCKYYITGAIDRNSNLYKLLLKYIRYPILKKRFERFNYNNSFDDIDSHLYYNVFSLALCE